MVQPLPESALRLTIPEEFLPFQHTGELEPTGAMIGQDRALDALRLGVTVESPGYNTFATGLSGGGRLRTVGRILAEMKPRRRKARDFVYVANTLDLARPRLLVFPAGSALRFQRELTQLLSRLFAVIPAAAASPPEPGGRGPADVEATPEKILVEASYAELDFERQSAEEEAALARIEREVRALFEALKRRHRSARAWLGELEEEVYRRLDLFQEGPAAAARKAEESGPDPLFLAFAAHVFHRGARTQRAPVVLVADPTFRNLFGGVEQDPATGVAPCHLHMRSGALHDADGGFLVLDAHDLITDAEVWRTLIRALRFGEIGVRNPETGVPNGPSPLRPDGLPVDVKVILLGSPGLYQALHGVDADFAGLFKVRAEFEESVAFSADLPLALARFLARMGRRERWRPLDRGAVAAILAWAGRQSGRGGRIRLAFGPMADLAREANAQAQGALITEADVAAVLAARRDQRGQLERRVADAFARDLVHIETRGAVVGQVNGLAVVRASGHSFGRPLRVSATVGSGRGGVVDIEREVGLSGHTHSKGVQIISGFLRARFGRRRTLALTATLCFEQSYGVIDGDSASAAELVALLSALSGAPVAQGLAITASVDQLGVIQPIGGVNDKIEGFFRVCAARGLRGDQGVLIPIQNAPDLALADDVVGACAAGQFHIWAVSTIEEAVGLLLGKPAGDAAALEWPAETVYGKVAAAIDDLERVVRQASKGPQAAKPKES